MVQNLAAERHCEWDAGPSENGQNAYLVLRKIFKNIFFGFDSSNECFNQPENNVHNFPSCKILPCLFLGSKKVVKKFEKSLKASGFEPMTSSTTVERFTNHPPNYATFDLQAVVCSFSDFMIFSNFCLAAKSFII